MKKPKLGGAAAIFIVMAVIIPAVFLWAAKHGVFVEEEYIEKGRKVSANVTTVARTGSNSQVMVKYKNDKGEWIEAYCIANQNPAVGQTLEGYVLPDDPYQVYCPPDNALKFLFIALVGGVAVGGWAVLISALKDRAKYNKLMKNGRKVKAELTSWHNENGGTEMQFRIFRQNGQEQIISVKTERAAPRVGEFYDLVIVEETNGKITAALADERAR